MKYHIVVLGCQMNLSDGERLRSVMERIGISETDKEEEADILGLVACSVRQKAIDKVHTRIHQWMKWKETSPRITFLTGCILPEDKKRFVKDFDLVFDIKDSASLPQLIAGHGEVTPAGIKESFSQIEDTQEDFWHVDPQYASSFEAFIPIQNGCNNFCTYCAVPYTRGREESRLSSEIQEEFASIIARGYKSITLLGQNVNSYGLDRKGQEITFPQLLASLGEMADKEAQSPWIYFTAPHPKDMTDELIEAMAKYTSIAKQIHLPIQSGDNRVLDRMNRRYTVEDFAQIVSKIRKAMPQATLFTDIIVGFPQESDEEFAQTAKAMEDFHFNMAFIAMYSPRPGAKSTDWQDDIPQETKKKRFHELSDIMQKSAVAYNQNLVGRELTVLVTGHSRKGDRYAGRTEGMINIQFESDIEGLVGQFIQVKITGVQGISLAGEPIPLKK